MVQPSPVFRLFAANVFHLKALEPQWTLTEIHMRATRFSYAIAFGLLFAGVTSTPAQTAAAKPTIVLVHGAFADASGFQYLIPLLINDGYHVGAVQNPL
jgi:hypothetical protein